MPKRTDIHSILILGAGPIVIGQACEFDYSGAQACKALREEGFRVILVNSNPATIMTDPSMADATYIEPIEWRTVQRIIEVEQPDALLPTMGGQTALNCALDLAREGVLAEHGVELIGATKEAIDKAEDRDLFDQAMKRIGLETPRASLAHSMEEAQQVLDAIGFPCIIRPSFTMGGSGGGIAYNREEFEEICLRGLDLSPTSELLIDESLIGWKEYEMEVVRDRNDNCIIVCSIENFDAMGVHTGDSITVAPAQTLTDKEYQIMRDASLAVLREIGVETGGSNVQFGVCPDTGRMVVIEMNPRVSRSSALASKATGFPIAKVAAKLAVGYTLDELANDITGGATPASFEPSIDYVVTKVPRFAFEKFNAADARLTTQMKSVGEVMAIGRNSRNRCRRPCAALKSAPWDSNRIWRRGSRSRPTSSSRNSSTPAPSGSGTSRTPFRVGMSVEEVYGHSGVDPWYLVQIEDIVRREEALAGRSLAALERDELYRLKRWVLPTRVSRASSVSMRPPCARGATSWAFARSTSAWIPVPRSLRPVRPTCTRPTTRSARPSRATPQDHGPRRRAEPHRPGDRVRLLLRARGTRHARGRLRDHHGQLQPGDRVHGLRHLRPPVLRARDARGRAGNCASRAARGRHRAVWRSDAAEACPRPGGGGRADHRHLAGRDRPRRGPRAIPAADPRTGPAAAGEYTVRSVDAAIEAAGKIGYPLVVRPSYVLGGRAMEIVYREEDLLRYMRDAVSVSEEAPVLLDRFLIGGGRGRHRRGVRRRAGGDRRDHAAYRAGRRALR
jgi:carbamoyl-phosphate synthase large subunit